MAASEAGPSAEPRPACRRRLARWRGLRYRCRGAAIGAAGFASHNAGQVVAPLKVRIKWSLVEG